MSESKPRGDRIADHELLTRTNEVAHLLLDGVPRAEIVRHSKDKWKISSSTVDRYISSATEDIAESYKPEIAAHTAILLGQLQKLARTCLATQNLTTANQVYGQIIKLLGLEKHQVEVQHFAENPILVLMKNIREGKSENNL